MEKIKDIMEKIKIGMQDLEEKGAIMTKEKALANYLNCNDWLDAQIREDKDKKCNCGDCDLCSYNLFKEEKVGLDNLTSEEKYLLILKDKVELVINRTEKANSFEAGPSGARHKIYYDTPQELEEHLKKLKELGLKE